jgi:signal transduction histidine kinase
MQISTSSPQDHSIPRNNIQQSLLGRLLWPLVAVSIAASLGVAWGSYWFASRSVEQEFADRYSSIASTLENHSFPLTANVLRSIGALTETELITARFDGTMIDTTLIGRRSEHLLQEVNKARLDSVQGDMIGVGFGGARYRAATFRRASISGASSVSPAVAWVVVLFDESQLSAARTRAVIAPLVTGLSTVAALTAIMFILTSRLVSRLSRLRTQVERIASGDFETNVVPGPPDEVGLLAVAVGSMATQRQQMWRSLHQREGERLLHQVAAGLAHNLRNSLTGARMAVELHRRQYPDAKDRGLQIAIDEIEQTENYVQRLLLVAAGKQEEDRPARVLDCLQDVRNSLSVSAKHRGIAIEWSCAPIDESLSVKDGPSLVAAVTNLIFNAMQIGTHVEVRCAHSPAGMVTIEVIDDGPGPAQEIQDKLFDAFVTTKPEGLGLGLPLVKRSAERLGGNVMWQRVEQKTVFTLSVFAS